MGIEFGKIVRVENGQPKIVLSDKVRTLDDFKVGSHYRFIAESHHLAVSERRLVIDLPYLRRFRIWLPDKIEVI